jgi:alanine dehydrogenase
MVIGVPRESLHHEHRVGLTPFLVNRLTELGQTVIVEREAGHNARFIDRDYQRVGAQIVYSAEEVYKRADLVCRIGAIPDAEVALLKPGLTVCAFHHLAVVPRERVQRLMELETTLIGYEVIRDEAGSLPVLLPMSEMAGQMAVHLAAHYLQNEAGGRGILLGHVPGVAPPTILVLGAGTVGTVAARQALMNGCHVIVMDADMRKLRRLDRELAGRVVTAVAGIDRLEKYTAVADVLVGAVLIPGERSPFLVTEEMVKAMKSGSVILDLSIDQGGCVETSRPTNLGDPVYVQHGVLHYCVPNMTANIARTASRALAHAILPYLSDLATRGPEAAIAGNPGLAQGAYMVAGRMVNRRVAESLGVPVSELGDVLAGGKRG